MKFIFSIFLFLFLADNIFSQNLFVNAGFEELNTCTELHQQCSPVAWFNLSPAAPPIVEHNAVPRPFTGEDLLIVPVENIFAPVKKRPFVYTMFCCPLEKGKNYKLSFYLHTAGKTFYGMDFCLQQKEFISANASVDSLRPSIHISKEDITDEYKGWSFIETVYTAKGDEKFCLIGNLSRDTFRFPANQRMNRAGDIFYFIDDISFSPMVPQRQCAEFLKRKNELYAQQQRHTERALVEKLPEEDAVITDTVTVPAVFFETDKAILKPAFKKLIDNLVLKLADKKVIAVKIEGHTDDRGTAESNQKLSDERAAAVLNYFVFKMPAVKPVISSEGKGEYFPKADNATIKGMAANRRVEIILTYKKSQ